jgi:hypothetical protein
MPRQPRRSTQTIDGSITVGAASNYLRELGKPRLDPAELDRFISYVAATTEKDERQCAVDHLLRVADLTPAQVMLIGASEPVRTTVGLQLSIRRYATSKQFEAAQQAAANAPAWKDALVLLGAVLPPC